jgi:hypothetical protein
VVGGASRQLELVFSQVPQDKLVSLFPNVIMDRPNLRLLLTKDRMVVPPSQQNRSAMQEPTVTLMSGHVKASFRLLMMV